MVMGMADEKYTMYGGQRGGGKIFALEQKIAKLQDELKTVKEERDKFAGEIARACFSEDKIRQQMVIRINYWELRDPQVAIDAICRELGNIMKPRQSVTDYT